MAVTTLTATCPDWEFPDDLTLYNFTKDCNVWGDWLSATMTPDAWNKGPRLLLGANMKKNFDLLVTALPPEWDEKKPTYCQAMGWWINIESSDFDASHCGFQNVETYQPEPGNCTIYWKNKVLLNEMAVMMPADQCPDQLCKAIARTGNPDLIGVGVSAHLHLSYSTVGC